MKGLRENQFHSLYDFFIPENIDFFGFIDYRVRIEGANLFFDKVLGLFRNNNIEIYLLLIGYIF